jgi:Na+/H+-dicarboxylate symporter
MSEQSKKSFLTLWIGAAIIAAVLVGLLLPHLAVKLHIGGEIFLKLLKMMVVPLVVMSVMSGILGLGDVRKLGRPGGTAALYYLTTTVIAVSIGIVVVNVMRPGVGTVSKEAIAAVQAEQKPHSVKAKVRDALAEAGKLKSDELSAVFPDLADEREEPPAVGMILKNLALMLFTDNLISSAAKMELLPLIVFSLVFAGVLTTMGARTAELRSLIEQVNDALLTFVLLLMKLAPLGIFCLVAARFGQAQADGKFLEVISQTGLYSLAVLTGLGIHALIVLPLLCWLIARKNPFRYMYDMSQALLTAFSTASSSATLPVTMECAITKAGVSKQSSDLVLPLGATVNMDGTALYEAVAAIFIAQALGFDLSLTQQLVIAVTATLAAIGAAGIPEAGLVTMLIVLNAVNLPVEFIALILPVDWLLDRFRTTVNVFGDAVGAAVVDRSI